MTENELSSLIIGLRLIFIKRLVLGCLKALIKNACSINLKKWVF